MKWDLSRHLCALPPCFGWLAERNVKTLKQGLRKSTPADDMETGFNTELSPIQLLEYHQLNYYWVDDQDHS